MILRHDIKVGGVPQGYVLHGSFPFHVPYILVIWKSHQLVNLVHSSQINAIENFH